MRNKKLQVWLPLLFSITMVLGMYFGYKMRDNMPGRSFFYTEQRRPMQEIIDLIRNRYVDDVDMRSIEDTAIQAMLSKLDPHSVFIPAEDLKVVNEELEGKFFGIGIEFNIFDDTLHVVNVLKDGPAYKAGLLTGDKFIKIDNTEVGGKKTNDDKYRTLLRGDRGTKVSITYLRNNEKKVAVITRDAIPLSSVDASYMMNSSTGYIRLNKFSSQTYREFMESLEALKKAGMKELVFDLRGNGGGMLEEAVEIADEFLAGDKLITYTEGKHVEKKEYRCRRNGQFETGKLVVLADEGSASASEILLGALQDWDRATIIGRRTFGKGLVQEQFELGDKSALRLTIARYFTPVGRSIQRPYDRGNKAYFEEVSERFDHSNKVPDSARVDSGRVFKTKGGKIIYEKGGITPDHFIALDTSGFSKNTAQMFTRNTINNFAYNFYLQNRVQLNNYKTPNDFVKGFVFTEENWKQFLQAAEKDTITLIAASPEEKQDIVNRLRSAIARQLWRNAGFFEVYNSTDAGIKKAMEILAH
jgi:carboxyl-terminal processing protease